MKKYKNDIIFIVTLLIIATVIYISYNFVRTDTNKAIVVVEVDGSIETTLDLHKDSVYEVVRGEAINVIQVKDGKVSVAEASCSDGICIKQGEVSKSNQSIICLPNRVVVYIDYEDEDEVDAVAR